MKTGPGIPDPSTRSCGCYFFIRLTRLTRRILLTRVAALSSDFSSLALLGSLGEISLSAICSTSLVVLRPVGDSFFVLGEVSRTRAPESVTAVTGWHVMVVTGTDVPPVTRNAVTAIT